MFHAGHGVVSFWLQSSSFFCVPSKPPTQLIIKDRHDPDILLEVIMMFSVHNYFDFLVCLGQSDYYPPSSSDRDDSNLNKYHEKPINSDINTVEVHTVL